MKLLNFENISIAESVVDFIFPKKCILCNQLVSAGKRYCFCDNCMSKLPSYTHISKQPQYKETDEIISALPYELNVRDKMILFKFHNQKYFGRSFGYAVYNSIKNSIFLKTANNNTIIAPVPIHICRDRAYNQSYVIAKELSKCAGIPCIEDLIVKINPIKPLSSMTKAEKAIFIKKTIIMNTNYIAVDKNIILVDDVYTTGATMNECALTLKNNGAKHVYGVTACYTPEKKPVANSIAADVWKG